MSKQDSDTPSGSDTGRRKKIRKPYQAPQLGRIDLEADRVLGFCHSGNPEVYLGGCDIQVPQCAQGS